MDAFDADIVIYASVGDPRGDILVDAVSARGPEPAGLGSVLLLTETLALGEATPRVARLRGLLAALELRPVDSQTARTAAALRAVYRLRTPDALHLATAICAGAERFVTGNRRDFTSRITEIDIAHPDVR
jgi:predicted nucleic acid-binding protein